MDKHKKRHNSRIVAAQCLYTRLLSPELPFDLDNTLRLLDEIQELVYEKDFVEQLVNGAYTAQERWDSYIDENTKYGASSFQPLERAVLWLGFYELSLTPRVVTPAIVIDEALEVLQDLSDERTKGLINGLLDRFSKSAASEN